MANQFYVKSDVTFGKEAILQLPDILKEYGSKNVLYVYDQGVKAVGIVDTVLDAVKNTETKPFCFDKVIPNPSNEIIEQGYDFAKENFIDTLVAIGGGSSMDTAKAINVLLSNGGHIMDYEGIGNVRIVKYPFIAIPTTAGTSSEITNVAALIDTDSVRKYVVIDNKIIPDKVIADPEFTRTIPASITATTGMDAITHAIESYISIQANDLTRYNSKTALEIFYHNLPKAVKDGNDMQAREAMMLGCVIVGFGFSNANLGLVHAIAHTLSAHYGLAHGTANACVLPAVLRFNAKACPEEMIELARTLHLPLSGNKEQDQFALASEMKKMVDDLQIKPLRYQGKGTCMPTTDFEMLASDALKEGPMHFNPRQDVTLDDIVHILKESY